MTLDQTYRETDEIFRRLKSEIGRVVVGQGEVIEHLLSALLAGGHGLIEGYPGLGKTLLIRTLSDTMGLSYSRIQCTPDLMPSDVTGTYIVEERDGRKEFRFESGPVFANIVLADEINRASPKTQSALLEAMQERQVTMGRNTYPLEEPFFVLATQNPIEMEGTFPLPEAQLDRFLLKIHTDYPTPGEEREIVDRFTKGDDPRATQVLTRDTFLDLQRLTRDVPISEENKQRAIDLVTRTRDCEELEYGASPRASIALVLTAKARALIHGRDHVRGEDIEEMAYPVLRHRVILTFEAERSNLTPDNVINKLLRHV